MVFEEKADNYAIYSKYRGVYALLISFLKQFKKILYHLIEHALRSLEVFCLSVCHSVCSTLETLFLKLFAKFFFHLLEQVLGSVLVKSEFKYLN